MDRQRRMRLWSLVVEHSRGQPVTIDHVCAAVIVAARVDGAAVTVVVAPGLRETLCASDPIVSEVEELALTLGEGPVVEALDSGPVLVADLAVPDCGTRWPMYTPAAMRAGVRAVFALPLQIGAIRLGVMALYRAKPAGLDREQLADALLLADTVRAMLLDADRRPPSRGNGSGPEHAGLQHPEVHQATGMLIVQLGVSAAVALVRLRAYAYSHDRRLRDVAADVVARRLRFHSEPAAEDMG